MPLADASTEAVKRTECTTLCLCVCVCAHSQAQQNITAKTLAVSVFNRSNTHAYVFDTTKESPVYPVAGVHVVPLPFKAVSSLKHTDTHTHTHTHTHTLIHANTRAHSIIPFQNLTQGWHVWYVWQHTCACVCVCTGCGHCDQQLTQHCYERRVSTQRHLAQLQYATPYPHAWTQVLGKARTHTHRRTHTHESLA